MVFPDTFRRRNCAEARDVTESKQIWDRTLFNLHTIGESFGRGLKECTAEGACRFLSYSHKCPDPSVNHLILLNYISL